VIKINGVLKLARSVLIFIFLMVNWFMWVRVECGVDFLKVIQLLGNMKMNMGQELFLGKSQMKNG
jgi:hypothetical protein